MSPWSTFDNLIMAMAKGIGKGDKKGIGNGKGPKGNGKGGHGKGGKGQHHTAVPAAPAAGQPQATDIYCKCCGKTKHVKSECHHRDKQCDNCGKTGHLKGVCNSPPKVATVGADAVTGQAATSKPPPGQPSVKVIVAPWICGGCMHQNLDHKATKCETCPLEKPPVPDQIFPRSLSSKNRCSTR